MTNLLSWLRNLVQMDNSRTSLELRRFEEWIDQRTWGASREFLAKNPELKDLLRLNHLEPASAEDPDRVVWVALLRRAAQTGIDEAYGELLAPWFMLHIPRYLTTKITTAGESSPEMFKLFQEHFEIFSVLHHCKRLKAMDVVALSREGANQAEQQLLSLAQVPDRETGDGVLENLATYEILHTLPSFPLLVSMVSGLHFLRHYRDEQKAFEYLNAVLNCDEPTDQRVRAIAADYLGLFYGHLEQ